MKPLLFIKRLKAFPLPERIILASALFVGLVLFVYTLTLQFRMLPLRFVGIKANAVVTKVEQKPSRFNGIKKHPDRYTLEFVDHNQERQALSRVRTDEPKINSVIPIVFNKYNPAAFVDEADYDRSLSHGILYFFLSVMFIGGVVKRVGDFEKRGRETLGV